MFADIAKGRGVPLETVRGWADGKIYSDKDALAMGLIDGIATVDEAANMLATAIRDGNRGRRDANRNRLRMETARSGGG